MIILKECTFENCDVLKYLNFIVKIVVELFNSFMYGVVKVWFFNSFFILTISFIDKSYYLLIVRVGKFLLTLQFRFFIQSFLDLPTPIGKSIFHSIEILSSFYLFSNCDCESENIILSIVSFTVIRC